MKSPNPHFCHLYSPFNKEEDIWIVQNTSSLKAIQDWQLLITCFNIKNKHKIQKSCQFQCLIDLLIKLRNDRMNSNTNFYHQNTGHQIFGIIAKRVLRLTVALLNTSYDCIRNVNEFATWWYFVFLIKINIFADKA